jgi:hypothetical protein
MQAVLIFRTRLKSTNVTCNHHLYVAQKYHKYGFVLKSVIVSFINKSIWFVW